MHDIALLRTAAIARPDSAADYQPAHHLHTYILLTRTARLAKSFLLKASSARYSQPHIGIAVFSQVGLSYHSPRRRSFGRVALQVDSRIATPAAATLAIQLLVVVSLFDVAEHLIAQGLERGHRVGSAAVFGGISS